MRALRLIGEFLCALGIFAVPLAYLIAFGS